MIFMVLFICIDLMISSCKEKGTNARDLGHQKDLELMTNLLTTQVEFIGEIREKKMVSNIREQRHRII